MAQTSAAAAPIPPAKKEDSEDVAWALSTAEAMYARGDRGDALKWLRRAAEAAAESQADNRGLELAKAAADLASAIGASTRTAAQVPAAAPSKPAARSVAPPPPPRPAVSKVTTWPSGARAPLAPKVPSARSVIPTPRAAEPKRRGRSNPPASEVVTPASPPAAAAIPPAPPSDRDTSPPPVRPFAGVSEDADGWPTQSLMGDDHADAPEEKTRIGVPAYEAAARMVTKAAEASAKLAPQASAAIAAPPQSAALRPAQALRVVVWRAADGVHVAPHGTRVAAISVEAILVALDPSADLAAWLSGK